MAATDPSSEAAIRDRLLAHYATEMAERRDRPLTPDRDRCVRRFAAWLRARLPVRVLEVGCGAGRDGALLHATGADYLGVDLSPEAVAICRDRGLHAVEADATDLPVEDDSVDAVWSMSTLMHLTDAQQAQALREIARVARPGGIVEIGVWGHDVGLAGDDAAGRHFNRRSDDGLRAALAPVGELVAFETWEHDGEHHYQWVRIEAN